MPLPITVRRALRAARTGKLLRGKMLALLAMLVCLFPSAWTQINPVLSSTNTQIGSPATSGTDLPPRTSATDQPQQYTTDATNAQPPLSASQITSILDQRPEAVVELKSLLADQIQQRGGQVTADDISDDQLYSQINSNADLRARVSTFLRARGYVTDASTPVAAASDVDPTTDADRINAATVDPDRNDPGRVSSGRRPLSSTSNLGEGVNTGNGVKTSSARAIPPSRQTAVHASTDEPEVMRSPAPYNLQSLRDLYTQLPQQTGQLKRFGSEIFLAREALSSREVATGRDTPGRETPLDVPLGPDYIVGPGDALTISVWGGVTQSITRTVDRDGRILLPEGGSQQVAGLPLGRVQAGIQAALKRQFRDAEVSITISQMRAVRVYVVGDVQRPGGYDLSALATPLSALIAAGGPTAAGSLRTFIHLRGEKPIEQIDLYDFLLHGMRSQSLHFESGDTLLVPPAGPQVALSGAVKRPAIYELRGDESTLGTLIDDAGGLTPAASLSQVTIDRIDAHQQRKTVTFALAPGESVQQQQSSLAAFTVRDGDRIHVAQILPYSERVLYLEGHVVRPGRQPYHDNMKLTDVLRSYQDMLPEPANRGEIVRLVAPDLHAETISFDVAEVLIGNQVIGLEPFDTIRIFGRYEVDAPKVTIHGEVLRPGVYPLSRGMTAAQLVSMAGGFRRDALTEDADLTSYQVSGGSKVVGSVASIRIGAAVAGTDRVADLALKPGDVLTIHQITGWNDIGESVTIAGQVAHPGSYGFREGERLSSILRRAGGFRETAYPTAAVLEREQVRELEEKSRDELVRQIETNSALARVSPGLAPGDSTQTLQLIQAQQDQVLTRLRSQRPSGRLVVHLSADIASWENTDADIELRRGDVLTIPKRPGFVLVTGQVYNATALTFTPGKTAAWYLESAGGANTTANRKEIFVIRADGEVIGRRSGGLFASNVLATKLEAGDVIVVPQKIFGGSLFYRNLLATAQLASSIAIAAAVSGL